MEIVVLDGATLNPGDNPWTGLEALGDLQVYERTEAAEVVARAERAEVLVVNKVLLDGARLRQLPHLRCIAVTATGYDCVDLEMAQAQGIVVANVPVYGTDSVAQHVFALLLHILHRVDLHDQAIRAGEWARRGDFSFWKLPLTELAGKTLGVVGFGRIGRQVADLAHAFGMSVMAHSRTEQNPPEWASFEWAGLDDLLRQSHVISLNCPLTPATTGIINRQRLALCRPNAILINASRGPLVVEADLVEALNAGRLGAAGLDVLSSEPIADDSVILTARNCFLTPHLAWATLEARQRLMQVTVENVASFLRGSPQNRVA